MIRAEAWEDGSRGDFRYPAVGSSEAVSSTSDFSPVS